MESYFGIRIWMLNLKFNLLFSFPPRVTVSLQNKGANIFLLSLRIRGQYGMGACSCVYIIPPVKCKMSKRITYLPTKEKRIYSEDVKDRK